MRNTRHITAADGHRFEVARADPAGEPKGGVIILHAIYGLTDHIRGLCDRWADAVHTLDPFDGRRRDFVHRPEVACEQFCGFFADVSNAQCNQQA